MGRIACLARILRLHARMTTMGFGVLFVLLMLVSGWWLYSRWAALRDAQARRREAEMLYVFQAKATRPPGSPSATEELPGIPGDFRPTAPGDRQPPS